MNKALLLLEKFTAVLALFLLPTQLALHFWPSYAFVFGIRVDYLSPAIYLSDILILVLFLFLVVNAGNIFCDFLKKNKLYLILLFVLALINIWASTMPTVSLFKWVKISEAIFLGVYFYIRKFFVGEKTIFRTLLFSSLFLSLIGIAQFLSGRTTGLFYFLGERSFALLTPGIALVQIQGQSFLRAYSVFSHPNSLAGYLGIMLIFILQISKQFKNSISFYFSYLILALCFLLTFSLTAFLAMGILLFITFAKVKQQFYKKLFLVFFVLTVLLSLLVPIFSNRIINTFLLPTNISQRLELAFLSGKMISDRFVFGEGLNTFIINSVKFIGTSSFVWFLQPVHNIFLLVFSETGILGILAFVFAILRAVKISLKRNLYYFISILFFIIFTGSLDHYWLTLQQNLLLIGFVSGYFLRDERMTLGR